MNCQFSLAGNFEESKAQWTHRIQRHSLCCDRIVALADWHLGPLWSVPEYNTYSGTIENILIVECKTSDTWFLHARRKEEQYIFFSLIHSEFKDDYSPIELKEYQCQYKILFPSLHGPPAPAFYLFFLIFDCYTYCYIL